MSGFASLQKIELLSNGLLLALEQFQQLFAVKHLQLLDNLCIQSSKPFDALISLEMENAISNDVLMNLASARKSVF